MKHVAASLKNPCIRSGNAEKNHESKRNLRKKAAMPLDGEANPLKNGKTNKNGVLNECGSFSWRFEQPKRLDFNNRPKKAQMYL